MLFLKRSLPFYAILLCTVFLFSDCQQDGIEDLVEVPTEPEVRAFPNVDERLWPFFQRFEEEAQELGIDVDLVASRISGEIENIDAEHVAGRCTTFGNFQPGNVTIDAEFFDRANDLFREFIIFHELGHCYLNRDHREDAFSTGTCVSIMRSGTLDCRDNYNAATRNAYIQELFEPSSVSLD